MNVNVNTSVGPDKSVTCDIDVDGRLVTVSIAKGSVTLAVATAGGDVKFSVPEALVTREPG